MHGDRRIARRIALSVLALGVLVVLALEDAVAQTAPRTTLGRLLGSGPVDTIAVDEYAGGELGGKGAHLLLVRTDSGYTGTLRMLAMVSSGVGVALQRCDTTMSASMSTSAAKRLFAFMRPVVLEPGTAPDRLPVSDYSWDASDRFVSGSNVVAIRNGSTVVRAEERYRTPLGRDHTGRTRPRSQFLDPYTRVMKVHEMLQPYLQPERLRAFQRACQGQ